ncbi:iron ABC transporter substrate-binding protein [Gloeocapsopsis dulcis]|uniref:Iron ABC transporter substrate-binding protein n=1 Tax=Gloeocapsopsis dulcis AAB1 = 1H9 TaxID=1433147 RepID=A0A6N8G2K2_9CHRO|nr:iron ABC transporter substrate-binding protein [Gloeocapsopsis dulcis]MUL39102.1 iron ABC transporter substrate-binding protein [Gloeocapsopsis dulcis AAB1 = 1H9]WNN88640.1 iron ABC transporter substrate-binding protein [Gloeocapsopsis dulcis]
MRRRKFVYLVGLATASGGMAIACTDNQTATTTTSPATTASPATGALENELVIYSGRNEELIGQLIEQFRQETGANVQVRYGDTAELAATILEEGNNSPADVYFAQDAGALGALQQEGRTAQLPENLLNQVNSRYRSPEGQWLGITGRVRTVDYNTNLVQPGELPQSIFGFTEPTWRGRIGWAPTNGSFQAFVTALRVSQGEEQARKWLEGIRANDPRVFPNNTSVLEGLTRGEVAVGFVNHYYLERIKQENPQVPVAHHFTNDVGSLVNVAGVAILNSARHPNIAQRFVEYLLTPAAQNYFATETREYPLASGVTPEGDLVSLNQIESQTPEIDLSNLRDLEGTLQLLQQTQVV